MTFELVADGRPCMTKLAQVVRVLFEHSEMLLVDSIRNLSGFQFAYRPLRVDTGLRVFIGRVAVTLLELLSTATMARIVPAQLSGISNESLFAR
jgi:hypothetical protein